MENLDCPCTVNEAEMFDPIPKQIVLQSAKEVIYSPITSIANNDGVIEFLVEGSNDEFIDLNETELVVEVKITKPDGSALAATDVVAPVNNWLHSMFSDIKLEIQNTVVEGGEHLHPYKAYIYNLLSHGENSKQTQLVNSGWYKDTHTAMNAKTNNKGFTARETLVAGSKVVQLSGPILLDMMLQNKYLLPKTGFKLAFTRMKPEFQVNIYTAATVEGRATEVRVKILNANLYIRRVKALPSEIDSIEERLIRENATYAVQRTVMNTFTIATGVQSYHCQNLFSGQLPKLIFIGLVRNDAYNGAYGHNPFNFEAHNVNSIKLMDSSGTVSFEEFKPDFTAKKIAREYNALFKTMGIYNQNESFDITLDEFASGFTIYAFNLTPDLHACGHQQVSRNATVRLDIGFSTNTTIALNIIAMGVFDGRIQITKDRQVFCDWKS